ncbi:hypothetical protein [Paraburkholderia youngii]|uniref:hypothetical protein n=1 Tax=Paraburkholderia youngii TaxID=2782701 RepID=UPI003D228D17
MVDPYRRLGASQKFLAHIDRKLAGGTARSDYHRGQSRAVHPLSCRWVMACRGARYHHDGEQYGSAAFCNLFLSEDKGLDLPFPSTDQRITLKRGTAVIFDTDQPHAVVQRGCDSFSAADFARDQDFTQILLTWELPIEDANVGRTLNVIFDIDRPTSLRPEEGQVWLSGAPAAVCPESGCWHRAD